MATEIANDSELITILANRKCISSLFFYSENTPESQQMRDVLLELINSGDYPRFKFFMINAEKLVDICKKYKVTSTPTFVFLLNGELSRHVGADVPGLIKVLNSLAKTIKISSEDLNLRLQKIINKSPCILFMKGSKDMPKCGFSRQVLELLADHNVQFETFDILEDNEVREGLKKYSNWPTYPQFYVNGELVGGMDILREMSATGELDELLSTVRTDKEKRLKELINTAPVMIFMKGSPEQPRCGFSKTLMEIMNGTGVKYETFDILSDQSVREDLKVFSNWPTYPQIYVKGSLIGGLDIIKEMQENGDLKEALSGE